MYQLGTMQIVRYKMAVTIDMKRWGKEPEVKRKGLTACDIWRDKYQKILPMGMSCMSEKGVTAVQR